MFWLTVPGDTVYHGREGRVTELEVGWSHCIHSHDTKSKQEVGKGSETSKPGQHDLLPLAGLHFLKVPQLS